MHCLSTSTHHVHWRCSRHVQPLGSLSPLRPSLLSASSALSTSSPLAVRASHCTATTRYCHQRTTKTSSISSTLASYPSSDPRTSERSSRRSATTAAHPSNGCICHVATTSASTKSYEKCATSTADERRTNEPRRRDWKREEAEWERIKQAGLITKEMNFLRARKTRDEQRRQSALLAQQLLNEAEEAEERRREADRQQQRWSYTVVARQTSVVYVVSRAAVRECMREQAMLCLRMCEWMEETEAYRNARWRHIEQQRADNEYRRRADGHFTAHQPCHQLPHAHQHLLSWQTTHQRTREQEREARDRWRREEDKKRTMDDTMHALHSSSMAMLTAVASEEAGGLGRTGLKSREEMDVVLLRARVEAELVKDAMKKRALLAMFKSDGQGRTEPQAVTRHQVERDEKVQDETAERKEREEEKEEEKSTQSQAEQLKAADIEQVYQAGAAGSQDTAQGEQGHRSSQLTVALSPAPSSVSLPPLRFDLLPPPSPVSDTSAIDVSDSASPSAASSPLPGVGSGPTSPMLSSTAASSMATSIALLTIQRSLRGTTVATVTGHGITQCIQLHSLHIGVRAEGGTSGTCGVAAVIRSHSAAAVRGEWTVDERQWRCTRCVARESSIERRSGRGADPLFGASATVPAAPGTSTTAGRSATVTDSTDSTTHTADESCALRRCDSDAGRAAQPQSACAVQAAPSGAAGTSHSQLLALRGQSHQGAAEGGTGRHQTATGQRAPTSTTGGARGGRQTTHARRGRS